MGRHQTRSLATLPNITDQALRIVALSPLYHTHTYIYTQCTVTVYSLWIVVGGFHAATTPIAGVWVGGIAVALCTPDRAPLIEPQKVLPNVARLRAVLAVPTPARSLRGRPFASVVPKLTPMPRGQVTVHCVAWHGVEELHVGESGGENGAEGHEACSWLDHGVLAHKTYVYSAV